MEVEYAPSAAATPAAQVHVPPAVRLSGVLVAAWCLGFAAVNAWQMATGRLPTEDFPGYEVALVVTSIVVAVVKVTGAGLALASLRPVTGPAPRWLLGTGLWGATSALALYSVGNLVITAGTLTGLIAPTEAWEAAGGVTLRAVAYVAFFVVGAGLFAVLAVSHRRRHDLHWTAVAVGVVGAPVLLGSLLVVLPAVLRTTAG